MAKSVDNSAQTRDGAARTLEASPAVAPPVRMRGVAKRYKNIEALAGVDLEVQQGRVVGLLGPNGAGKSTMLRMIVGLGRPDVGTIEIFGHRVRSGAPVLSRVGVSIEEPGLSPHLTGFEQLRQYWAITGRPEDHAHLDTVTDVSGLGSVLHRRISGYSQGMRHRLAVAQAMLGLPDLLVLDEPEQGLDPIQLTDQRAALRDYASSGRTVLLSSHHLAEVEQSCSDVILLVGGRVAVSGSLEDLDMRLVELFARTVRASVSACPFE